MWEALLPVAATQSVAWDNTYEYKDAFKAAGFRWVSKKKMWYWRSEADATTSRGKMSMQEIRQKYGSEILETETKRVTA